MYLPTIWIPAIVRLLRLTWKKIYKGEWLSYCSGIRVSCYDDLCTGYFIQKAHSCGSRLDGGGALAMWSRCGRSGLQICRKDDTLVKMDNNGVVPSPSWLHKPTAVFLYRNAHCASLVNGARATSHVQGAPLSEITSFDENEKVATNVGRVFAARTCFDSVAVRIARWNKPSFSFLMKQLGGCTHAKISLLDLSCVCDLLLWLLTWWVPVPSPTGCWLWNFQNLATLSSLKFRLSSWQRAERAYWPLWLDFTCTCLLRQNSPRSVNFSFWGFKINCNNPAASGTEQCENDERCVYGNVHIKGIGCNYVFKWVLMSWPGGKLVYWSPRLHNEYENHHRL